jgi:SAM-dependent methyltransferase
MDTETLFSCNFCENTTLEPFDPENNLVRCARCHYVFDNPRPSLEALVRFYSKPAKYDSWLNDFEARNRLWRRRLRKLRSQRKPGSLLDVGTGIGQFLSLARPFYTTVYGTEISTTAVALAREKYGLNLFQGTIEGLVGQGKTFDNITLFHVLEHVSDPRLTIEACHALLSPDGILVIAVPNEIASLRGRLRALRGGRYGIPRISLDGSIDEIHLSHFTPRVLQRALENTGFSVVTNTPDPYFLRKGLRRLKAEAFYFGCVAFQRVFGVNLFDAMLLIARKVPS